MMEIKTYTDKKEYNKARAKTLKFLQKTYRFYKNIEEGIEFWEKKNILKE